MIKKRFVILTFICLLLIANCSSALNIENKSIFSKENLKLNDFTTFFADIYVDDDARSTWYDETHVKTIKEGITNASEGYIIYVYNGTYFEYVIVNKSIYLVGENKQNTIIDGKRKGGNVLSVFSDYVYISNFTIQNCSQELDFPRAGIRIYSNYTTVKNNIITKNQNGIEIGYLPGIYYKCYFNLVTENTFLNNENLFQNSDLTIYSSYNIKICDNEFINTNSKMFTGISLFDSDNNIIYKNNFSVNFDTVLFLQDSNNNTIYSNIISNGDKYGVHLIGSDKNNIHHNSIQNIFFGLSLKESNQNEIHHNNFKRCIVKSIFIKSSFNKWYRNYWGRPRFLPKLIVGRKGQIFPIPWLNFDILPKIIPNKI